MKYLLDTNMVIALLDPRRRDAVLSRLLALPVGEAVTSTIVAHELYFGAAKSAHPEGNRRRFAAVLSDLRPISFSEEDAQAAGSLRANLKSQGTPIGPYDCLIAGQALERGLILATNNVREFRRVSGLVVEDWLG